MILTKPIGAWRVDGGTGRGRGIKRKVLRNAGEGREAKCLDCVTPGCSARMILKTFSFMRKLECESHSARSPKGCFAEKDCKLFS